MWPLQIPGELVMGTGAPEIVEQSLEWRSLPVNRWMMVAAAVIFLINLPNYYNIFPHLVKCASVWRRNISLENNIQLVRSRDMSLWASVLPVTLVTAYYGLAGGRYLYLCPEAWRTLAVLGGLAALGLLRQMIYLLLGTRVRGRQTWQAAHRCDFNFFVLLGALFLVTEAVISICGTSDYNARIVFWVETGLLYLLFFVRKSQILGSNYSQFTTFLYLCALELLPTGILIWISL